MTAEEFEAEWVAGSGMTAKEASQVVRPCACDYEKCQGWAMVSQEMVKHHDRLYGPKTEKD